MDEQETDSLLCPNCQVPLQNRCCPECSTTDTHEQQATNGRNNGGCETNSSPSDESLRNHLHDIVKEHGLSGITQAVIDDLYASKVTIKICVVGQSCTGKSYLINSMRGLKPKDVGAAKVGVIQTTIKISQYPDPKYPNIVYFDVPGFGNPEYPKGKYLKTIAIETYAFFIFVSDSIISENDAWLANEIKKLGRKMYFVRTKIDDAIRNNVSDNEMPESLTMKTIRDDYERSLVKYTISSHNIFLINNRDTSAFEFPLLRKQLTEDKNDLKKQELTRALKLVTIDVLEKERTLLEGRLYKPALLSSAAALLPVVDIYIDYKIFTYEENSYREAFGTDERSLSHIAQQMNVSVDETKTYGLNKETIFGSALSVVSFCAATGAGAAGAIQGHAQVTSYAFPIVGDVAASLISYPTSKFLLGKILNQRYEEALSIHGRYYEHLTQNMKCRKKYYKHIRKASADKMEGRHLSIIIDNMDQGKSSLPSFCTKSKSDAHLYRLQHHITRVNVHNTNQTYLFTWTDAFRPDANITLNALVHALSDLCKNFQRLPEVLYLQLDNYGMDNKNAFVLIFMAYLVKMKIFQKVKVGFLMVGHTHEDIDQVFSRVAPWIRRRDMVTLQDLVDNLRDSQQPSPVVEQLTCYDYKHSLEGCRGLIQGIATPHDFIMTEVDGKVTMRYRGWPGSPDHHRDISGYIPQHFDAVGVTTNPKVLGEIQKMSADMAKWQATGRLSTPAVEWWTRYLAEVSHEREPCVPFVDTLPRQKPWSPSPPQE